MITREEAINADVFHEFVPKLGLCRTWRRNGKTKTWKRSTERIEVPMKFGMYDYMRWTEVELAEERVHTKENCPYK